MITKNDYYKKIGNKIIRQEFPEIAAANVRVAWLESDEEKKKGRDKLVLADCRVVSPQYEWCCHYQFMITVYAPNVAVLDLDEEQIGILLRHELMHIGIDNDGNEPSYYTVPHDVEEFDSIIDRYGLRWQQSKKE